MAEIFLDRKLVSYDSLPSCLHEDWRVPRGFSRAQGPASGPDRVPRFGWVSEF